MRAWWPRRADRRGGTGSSPAGEEPGGGGPGAGNPGAGKVSGGDPSGGEPAAGEPDSEGPGVRGPGAHPTGLRTGARRPRATLGNQAFAVIAMTVVWSLLWGDFTWGNLASGLLLALLVLVFFPLPAFELRVRFRPLAALRFAGRFLVDLVVASAHVTWTAIRPTGRLRNAMISVPLRVNTELNLALVSEALSLLPGSVIVEVRPPLGMLYVHVLDVKTPADAQRARESIRQLEARIVRAIGSPAAVRQVTRPGAGAGRGPEGRR